MDDLGSEQICKLSCNKNQQKTNNSAIYYDYDNTATANATSTAINESNASVASISITTAAAACAANASVIVGTAPITITTINNGSAGTITTTTTTKTTKSSPIISGKYDTRFDKQNTSTMLMMKKPMNKKNDFEDDDSDIMNKNSSNSMTPISISSGNDSSPEQQQHHQQQQYNQTMMGAASDALITGYCGGGGGGDGVVLGGDSFGDDDSDEKEKTDITPENMKKLDDVILASSRCGDRGNNSRRRIEMKSAGVRDGKNRKHCDNVSDGDDGGGDGGSGGDDDDDDNNIELKIVEDESPTKQNLAFTIEFSEGESSAAAARYKNMVERFQNRHRRGASLSKLDDNHSSNSPIGIPPIAGGRTSRVISAVNQRQQQKYTGSGSVASGMQSSETNQNSEANKVKLRIRDRSTSGVRDASKRHSWSPRSSIHESFETQQQQQHLKHREKQKMLKGINSGNMITNKESVVNYQRQTTTTTTRPPDKFHSKIGKKSDMRPSSPHLEGNTKKTSKTFTPRSTAMQLALNKVEFLCPEPPLDDFSKGKNIEGDDNGDSVSEAGTYTVDGDNYTEEQKEQMNIDKSAGKFTSDQLSDLKIDSALQIRPSELSLHTTNNNNNNIENQRRTNILEINYYHDSTSLKPKISYLEKIKSRVRNMGKPPDKKLKSPSDVGIFTSVTTSGVLSIKPTLDPNPKVNRRNSLTKSHVDSSEYISADNSFKGCSGANTNTADKSPYSSTFTDHQKAEYKLNLFSTTTNQTDSQILNENYSDVDTPITPDSPTNSFSKSVISETGLKTAQTKNDWIQEWARNARARSQSATTTCSKVGNEQMSRSYNFEAVDSIGFGDTSASAMYHNKAIIDRLRSHGIGDLEYSSDPNVSTLKNANITTNNNGSGNVLSTRPPMSPSKIPSPMHSIGRARSVSRTRGSLQDLSPSKTAVAAATPTDSTDIYLQKTAAAISNLTQSFSRKNSLQSTATAATKLPPSSSTGNSPRHHIFPQHYSADEYSPTHTKHHYSNHSGHHQHHSTVHKRNLSLDYRNNMMSHSLNTEALTTILGNEKQRTNQSNRPKQHSYDGAGYESPKLFQRKAYIDQTTGCLSSTKQSQPQSQPQQQSPIRRSSSFSTRPMSNSSSGRQQQASNSSRNIKKSTGPGQNSIQKSASSTSFRKMYSDYDDSVAYYINDEDDLIDAEYCLSSDEFDDSDHGECYVPPIPAAESEPSEPLTNTRYNKALLMRIERSKQRVANMQGKLSGGGGVVACPNTPEMPRRAVQSAGQRASIRQSVPRDSSLSRLKAEVPNSLASAKKHLLQTVASSSTTSTSVVPASSNTGKKVQPKYMDISKYKPVQSANFLRKDDTKSTLITRSTEIKRSPSSASVALNRTDPARASNRSVKSLNSRSGSGGSKREPPSASKQKEVELAMWKRRATYDPMKSAAEDRKKKEEAKKLAQSQAKSTDSSIVTRSQSFHSGVTLMTSSSSKLQFHHNHSDFRNNDFNDDDDDDENACDENYAGNYYDDDNEDDNNGTENFCIGNKNKQLKKNDYDQEDNEAAATIKSIKINNNNNKNFNKYRWSSTESNNKYGRNTIGGCIQGGVNDDDEED